MNTPVPTTRSEVIKERRQNEDSLRVRLLIAGLPEDSTLFRIPDPLTPQGFRNRNKLQVVENKVGKAYTEHHLLGDLPEGMAHHKRLVRVVRKIEVDGKGYTVKYGYPRSWVTRMGKESAEVLVAYDNDTFKDAEVREVRPKGGLPFVLDEDGRRVCTNPRLIKKFRRNLASAAVRGRYSSLGKPSNIEVLYCGRWRRVHLFTYTNISGDVTKVEYRIGVARQMVMLDDKTVKSFQDWVDATSVDGWPSGIPR